MNKSHILLAVVIGLAAVGLYNLKESREPKDAAEFNVWMEMTNKDYSSSEKNYRFMIWSKNYAFVKEHNARYEAGLETYEVEMNEFADMTTEEFASKYLMQDFQPGKTEKCTGKQAPTVGIADKVDWSDSGAVTGIKNQGQCGSCWAFSATGSLEGANFITTQTLNSFSEQQLVDCSKEYGNHGCGGGLMNFSFFYVKDHGITLESKYPYHGRAGKCSYNEETDKAWTISDCTEVTVNSEASLLGAISQQPVSVAIQANHLSFQLYKKGVYSGNCGTNLDHGVLAVGYGDLDGKKFYKVKNSWGANWGSHGYIYIARTGDGKGKCGIQMAASFPVA